MHRQIKSIRFALMPDELALAFVMRVVHAFGMLGSGCHGILISALAASISFRVAHCIRCSEGAWIDI